MNEVKKPETPWKYNAAAPELVAEWVRNRDFFNQGGIEVKMTENKLVYIASPYAGDVERNTAFAKEACRYAMGQDAAPIAVHLLYPQILDDMVPAEREAGLRMGLRVLEACDELWVCGDRISAGMQAELEAAERLGILVRCIPKQEISMGMSCPEMKMCPC